jgi:hypothetical protein
VALWGLVAAGGVGGVGGLLLAGAAGDVSPVGRTSAGQGVPVDVAGYAQLSVGTWLGAGPDEEAGVNDLFAVDPEVRPGQAAAHRAHELAVVATRQIDPGRYWAVTVAAAVDERASDGRWAPVGTWYLEVGVARDGRGRLTAVGEPAVVPAPRPSGVPPVAAGPRLDSPGTEDDAAIATVDGYLRALLTGDGDVSRYLAPRAEIAAVSPPPFADVRVDRIAVTAQEDDTARLRVAVEATSTSGAARSLGYELTLTARDDRWEIAAMSGAPALRPVEDDADPPSSTSTSSPSATTTSVASAPGA